VFICRNNGIEWMRVAGNFSIYKGNARPVVGGKGILWIAGKAKIFGVYADGSKFVEKISENIKIDSFAISHDGELWMVGRAGEDFNQDVLLIKRENAQVYKVVSKLPYFLPKDLWVGNDIIYI
jgi:hypothetical protein